MTVSKAVQRRIWGDAGFRLFLSHRAQVKKETAELAESLKLYGISAFVAHVQIRPTKVWMDEIEAALATMEMLAALLTSDFHDSEWTDQEIGYALGRNVPVLALSMGVDPKGFVGRFQAAKCDWVKAPETIVSSLINFPGYFARYIETLNSCGSFDMGNVLATPLSGLEEISLTNAEKLVRAYNDNGEVRGSFGFNGTRPERYGPGLLQVLQRLHPDKFKRGRDGKIVRWV